MDNARRQALQQLIAVGTAVALPRAQAGVDWLVSPAEVAAIAAQPAPPLLAVRTAGAPVIEVLQPVLDGRKLASPLPIQLEFRAGTDATIDPASLRVFYGALQIDVTQRLLKSVAVRPDGLRVEQAAIPAGSHRLVVQIADTLRRVGTRELRFSVA